MSRAALQIFSLTLLHWNRYLSIFASAIFAQYSHASALDVVMVRVGGTLAPARERNSLKLQKNVRTKNTRPQSQHCHHCFCRPRMEHWKIFVLLQKIFLVLLYTISNNILKTPHYSYNFCEAQGKGRARGGPGRSLKGHLWMVDGGYPFPDALH